MVLVSCQSGTNFESPLDVVRCQACRRTVDLSVEHLVIVYPTIINHDKPAVLHMTSIELVVTYDNVEMDVSWNETDPGLFIVFGTFRSLALDHSPQKKT